MVRALLDGAKTQTRRAQQSDKNRFGAPGERLWVRETYFAFGHWSTRPKAGGQKQEWFFVDRTLASGFAYRYALDEPDGADPGARRVAGDQPRWHRRPALFMPRVASRLLLEIVEVRVERLQEISAADALAEGVGPLSDAIDPVLAYRAVWERINGVGSWDDNPLVWVVTFRRLP